MIVKRKGATLPYPAETKEGRIYIDVLYGITSNVSALEVLPNPYLYYEKYSRNK